MARMTVSETESLAISSASLVADVIEPLADGSLYQYIPDPWRLDPTRGQQSGREPPTTSAQFTVKWFCARQKRYNRRRVAAAPKLDQQRPGRLPPCKSQRPGRLPPCKSQRPGRLLPCKSQRPGRLLPCKNSRIFKVV
ncbi:hypothetical protein RRG08_007018 [Elysia crispata]|uniref:Uncharacterized protein n=1 Tax=Elysia crispata TaxID=231223 RepID=A0AAE0ZJJ5_9GAST|nr:hypothetical protein RRG08_007018 [Elysia crispata]